MNPSAPVSRLAARRVAPLLGAAPLIFLALAANAGAAVVTVNDTGDSSNPCATTGMGTCTLRDAITYANAHSGSAIAFGIGGSGVHTISPATPYPTLTVPVTIDGFTQPGSSANTNGPGLGDNSVHLIEIDGTNTGGGNFQGALILQGSFAFLLRGLVINRAPAAAVEVLTARG